MSILFIVFKIWDRVVGPHALSGIGKRNRIYGCEPNLFTRFNDYFVHYFDNHNSYCMVGD